MNYSIGIDFGTTKTLVAYLNDDTGKAEVAHLGRETNSIPSTAYVSDDNRWEFGDDADDYAAEASYIKHFKLSLGSSTPVCQRFSKDGYLSYTAREVTSRFFEYIRKCCEDEVFNGNRVTGAIITHPVTFSPAQLDDLRKAAEDAGFSEIRLMCEPEAAGIAFCRMSLRAVFDGTALVVDWGGGSLDLALVSRQGNNILLHKNYVSGVSSVGGLFFDELLLQHAEDRLQQMGYKMHSEGELSARPMQLKRVKSAKERLSRQESVKLILCRLSGPCPALIYTRADLEEVLAAPIKAGMECIDSLLSSVKESSLRPAQVLLIGGSSKIPCISEQITQHTGLDCHRWQFSHEAVALGAVLSLNNGYLSTNAMSDSVTDKLEPPSAARLQEKYNQLDMTSSEDAFPDGISAEALINLGDSYYTGIGNEQDYRKAVECYQRAAEMGNVKAQAMLASCYWDGKGVTQSYKDAAKWYERAAEQGDVVAQNRIGVFYYQGVDYQDSDCHVVDYANAIKWFRKAAAQGDPKACYNLALCYQDGLGVKQSEDEAVKWYKKAAFSGNTEAEYQLGRCYEQGRGVPQSYSEAEKWYSRAASQGHEEAKSSLESLRNDAPQIIEEPYAKRFQTSPNILCWGCGEKIELNGRWSLCKKCRTEYDWMNNTGWCCYCDSCCKYIPIDTPHHTGKCPSCGNPIS